MRELDKLISDNYAICLEENGFICDTRRNFLSSFVRIKDNSVAHYIVFTDVHRDSYVIDVRILNLFVPKMKLFNGVVSYDLGRRIENYIIDITDEVGRFNYQDENIFQKGVERVRKGLQEVIFPWYDKHSTVLDCIELIKGNTFCQPDIGWKHYDLFFAYLYVGDYKNAKIIGDKIRDEKLLRFEEAVDIFEKWYNNMERGYYEQIKSDFEETVSFKKKSLKLDKIP